MMELIERIARQPSKLLTAEGWKKGSRHAAGLWRQWRKRIAEKPSQAARTYGTYEDYVAHQRSKLDEMINAGTGGSGPPRIG